MSTRAFDDLTRHVGGVTTRRHFSKSLAALAFAAPTLALAKGASAVDNERDRNCKDRCRRRCEDRDNPGKCRQDCRERRCRNDD